MSETLIQPETASQPTAGLSHERWWSIGVCSLLFVAVVVTFGRSFGHGFLNWDDNGFVYNEPNVSAGLTWRGIAWAFTDGPGGEWYPLAMLSHMLDCQIYGLSPTGHHLTNVLLHALTTIALFWALFRLTGVRWPSALAAALFALHPLRAESVAWIAERRDVLSGLFFALTLAAYAEYVRQPRSLALYLAVALFFTLGLLSKAIVVTLPELLLLLDFWPLGRLGHFSPTLDRPGSESRAERSTADSAVFPWRVIVEKVPLLVLSVAAALVTLFTHAKQDFSLPIVDRLQNATISCVAYLGQFLFPWNLSAFYCYPEAGWSAWQVAGASGLLLAITAAVVLGRRKYPYFFVGWFWYVGMLVPVLGFTSLGTESRADRYTYLPQIGLDIALVWGAAGIATRWPARRWAFGSCAVIVLIGLAASSWRQTGFWRDDKTLWEHALACDPTNVKAHRNLGVALEVKDDRAAGEEFRLSLEMSPYRQRVYKGLLAKSNYSLGEIAKRKGKNTEAVAYFERALEVDPDSALVQMELGVLFVTLGKFDEAMKHFDRGMELDPKNADIYSSVALLQADHGMKNAARANFEKAIQVAPDLAMAHSGLGKLLAEEGNIDAAITHFQRAIELKPDVPIPYQEIARLLRRQGQMQEAAKYEERGNKARRRFAANQVEVGDELVRLGRLKEAITEYQGVLAIDPKSAKAHKGLADALASQGNLDQALAHYRQALAIDPNFAAARQSLERLTDR